MSKKSETGLSVIIRGFIPTNGDLQATNDATTAAVEAIRTGDYTPLMAMMKVDDCKVQLKTRRIADVEPGHVKDDVDVVDIEELIDTKTAA